MSYDPYALFGEEEQEPSGGPVSAPKANNFDPHSLFDEGATQPLQAPTEAPTASGESGLPSGLLNAVSGAVPAAGALRVADQVGLSDYLAGPAEAAMTMGSSMVAEPLAGLAGLKETFFGDGASAGADTVEAVRQALTYTPKTEEGRAAMEAVGAFLAPVGDAITATSETLGDTAEALGAPPSVSTMMYTLPEAALTILPSGAAVKASRASKAAKLTKDTAMRTEMLQNPTTRLNSATGAQWKLNKEGVAEVNTVGRKLVDDGADAADAALITNSDKATKIQMKAMMESFDKTARGNGTTLTPSQILGQNAAKAVGDINEARKKVGAQLEEMVAGKLGNTRVDIREPLGEFYKGLTEMGVRTRVGKDGRQRLDFSGTDLDLKTFGSARNVLQDAFDMTLSRGPQNLRSAHKLKQRLDNLLDAKKLEQGGALGNIERSIANLRKGINDTAGKQVDGYAQVNAQYGALRDSLSSFDNYKPAGVSWDSPKVANNLGAAMKSAAADTAQMNNMMESLTSAAKTMHSVGAKTPTVDVIGLARFNDFLNTQLLRSINATAKKDVSRGITNNVLGASISGAVGNKFGVANNVVGVLRNTADAATVNAALRRNAQLQSLVRRGLID